MKQKSSLAKGNALEELTKKILEEIGFNITLTKVQKWEKQPDTEHQNIWKL